MYLQEYLQPAYHQKKVHRSKANRINKINSQLKITLIDSPGYKKNISLYA